MGQGTIAMAFMYSGAMVMAFMYSDGLHVQWCHGDGLHVVQWCHGDGLHVQWLGRFESAKIHKFHFRKSCLLDWHWCSSFHVNTLPTVNDTT